MERKILALAFAILLLLTLLATSLYWNSIQASPQEQEHDVSHTTPSLIASPTLNLTATQTPPPSLAPTTNPQEPIINFTKWHPSEVGENTLIIANPENNSVIETSNLSLQVYATSKSELWAINSIWYMTDWLEGARKAFSAGDHFTDNIFVTINFTGISNGDHSITLCLSTHDGGHTNATVYFRTINVS